MSLRKLASRRATHRRAVIGLTAVCSAALALSACGSSGSSGSSNAGASDNQASSASGGQSGVDIAAAKKEGSVLIYTGSGLDQVRSWGAAFTKKYGIKVNVVDKGTYPVWTQWQQEYRAGKPTADLFYLSDSSLLTKAITDKQLMKFTPSSSGDYPAKYTSPGYFYPLQENPLAIGWNSSKVSASDIASIKKEGYNALVNPKWKGVTSVVTPASGGSDYTWWYYLMEGGKDKYGTDFIKKLAALNPKVYTSSFPGYDGLAAGDYYIIGDASTTGLSTEYAKGAPVQWMYPDPTPVFTVASAIAVNAPHPNAAKLFQEWATSVPGEEAWYSGSAVSDAIPMNSKAKDLSKFTKESWYKAPTNLYNPLVSDLKNYTAKQNDLISSWQSIMGGQ
ncbi:ABC transporter substrate-binding protein [Flexivirga oryzae]|uniref:ABC-type Fe3+ transport system substrate-binding protein n=1 Tax=Flexivirga oryzae TaxID=1794944 RepID=A0A839N2D3_9MICO|nr:ABC transporter substrate-binding protein [Flexivirga oryzae]MBB2891900.1 ABC-type Fe3+ transport system substrate-binding protein [Flexivirga oryzae]